MRDKCGKVRLMLSRDKKGNMCKKRANVYLNTPLFITADLRNEDMNRTHFLYGSSYSSPLTSTITNRQNARRFNLPLTVVKNAVAFNHHSPEPYISILHFHFPLFQPFHHHKTPHHPRNRRSTIIRLRIQSRTSIPQLPKTQNRHHRFR